MTGPENTTGKIEDPPPTMLGCFSFAGTGEDGELLFVIAKPEDSVWLGRLSPEADQLVEAIEAAWITLDIEILSPEHRKRLAWIGQAIYDRVTTEDGLAL